ARAVPTTVPPTSATSRIQGTSSVRATPAARRARRAATVSARTGRARLWIRTMASRSESTAARMSGRRGSGQDKGGHRVEGGVDLGPHEALAERRGDAGGQVQDRSVPEDRPPAVEADEDSVVVHDGTGAGPADHHPDAGQPGHLPAPQPDL